MFCNHVSSFKECYAFLEKCWTLWTNAASFECKNTSSREIAHRAFLLKGHPGRAIYSSGSFCEEFLHTLSSRNACSTFEKKTAIFHSWSGEIRQTKSANTKSSVLLNSSGKGGGPRKSLSFFVFLRCSKVFSCCTDTGCVEFARHPSRGWNGTMLS